MKWIAGIAAFGISSRCRSASFEESLRPESLLKVILCDGSNCIDTTCTHDHMTNLELPTTVGRLQPSSACHSHTHTRIFNINLMSMTGVFYFIMAFCVIFFHSGHISVKNVKTVVFAHNVIAPLYMLKFPFVVRPYGVKTVFVTIFIWKLFWYLYGVLMKSAIFGSFLYIACIVPLSFVRHCL